jgi:hypothetical protein
MRAHRSLDLAAWAAAAACAAALAACGVPEHGPSMDPGEDCVGCHNAGEGPDFSAAGTLYTNLNDPTGAGVKGGVVTFVDANGRTLDVKSNEVGNFYTREKLAFPLQRVSVRRGGLVAVMEDVPTGACNDCHTRDGRTSSNPAAIARGRAFGRVALVAPGEEMLPGEDCQACHVAGGSAAAKPFTLSGTVFQSKSGGAGVQGAVVTVTGTNGTFSTTTNRVGNFWFEQDVGFPIAANATVVTSGGQAHPMDEPIQAPRGCNGCHRPGGEGEGRVSISGHDD